MTITEHLRKHLLRGVPIESVKFKFISIEALEKSQWCRPFLKLMKNRTVLGAFRYGKLSSQKHSEVQYDNLASVKRRLELYETTGNTEYLVDSANLLMIEFLIGEHPNKHFKAVDDGEHCVTK